MTQEEYDRIVSETAMFKAEYERALGSLGADSAWRHYVDARINMIIASVAILTQGHSDRLRALESTVAELRARSL